jgi:hypothetical protein
VGLQALLCGAAAGPEVLTKGTQDGATTIDMVRLSYLAVGCHPAPHYTK